MDSQELAKQISNLTVQIDKLSSRYSTFNMFVGGMLRGAGIVVGATLLVLVGSAALGVLGLLPGLDDIVRNILVAFEKAQVR